MWKVFNFEYTNLKTKLYDILAPFIFTFSTYTNISFIPKNQFQYYITYIKIHIPLNTILLNHSWFIYISINQPIKHMKEPTQDISRRTSHAFTQHPHAHIQILSFHFFQLVSFSARLGFRLIKEMSDCRTTEALNYDDCTRVGCWRKGCCSLRVSEFLSLEVVFFIFYYWAY